MRIVAIKHIRDYERRYPKAGPSLRHWETIARAAKWRTTNDVTFAFGNAKSLNAQRVRFEVQGGHHRLICAFNFTAQVCYVKFIGTHEDYDAVNALTVALF